VRSALFADESDEAPAELRAAADFLTAEPGFLIRMTLGSEPARGAGGSGTLARATSPTVSLTLPVSFSADATPGLDPLQGDVAILKESKYFSTPPCFWLAEHEGGGGDPIPALWQMRVNCLGIDASGATLLPEGPTFFNARLQRSRLGEWELFGGTITVKEQVPLCRGILAELKIVGTFDVQPQGREQHPEREQPQPSADAGPAGELPGRGAQQTM